MLEEFSLLPLDQQAEILDALDPQIVEQMALGYWWWQARPEQIPPEGSWDRHIYLAGRGSGKTRSGAEWLIERTLAHPFDVSGFPTERLVMAYSLSEARMVCIEGPSGLLRVLHRMGFKETGPHYSGPKELRFHYTRSPKPHITFLETEARIFFTGADPDAARGFNLADVWCVAEGEPVATRRGMVPIEDVLPGDLAFTDYGWREVVAAVLTKKNADLIRVSTSEGCIELTPEHIVWANKRWVRADSLKPGDTMDSCLYQMNQYQVQLQLSTTGTMSAGITTRKPDITTAEMDSCCTGLSGLPQMGQSPKGMTSTTSTASAGITGSLTSNFSHTLSTCAEHGKSAPIRTRLIQQQGPSGLPQGCWRCGNRGHTCLRRVSPAAKLTTPTECGPRTAPRNAVTQTQPKRQEISVQRVEKVCRKANVYDLTIAGARHFYAGTAMVKIHNCDEIVKYIDASLCWKEGVRPALRADIPGDKPRAFITTTPKPIPLLQDWVQEAKTGSPSISMVRGSTFDNKLNLSEDFLRDIAKMYEGTALGRQELYGEMLDGFEGALFPFSSVHNHRVTIGPQHVAHRTVGVDPGLTGSEDGDETGVIVVCRDENDHMFVVGDETVKLSGRDAALHAWRVFERYGCDTLVYESNLGKAWMQQVFTDAFRELQRSGVFPAEVTNPPLVPVFSTQGKKLRAEPVAMRYNQGRVHHIGTFETLENQMFSFDPITSKTSPDRLDALVHACRHLIDGERRKTRLISPLNYKFESAFGPAF